MRADPHPPTPVPGTGVPAAAEGPRPPRRRVHRAWWVAATTFLTIVGAASFASLPGLLVDPLNEEFAW
ncbi:hypothetical protein ACWHAO_19440 [Streptomyces albidoflavus]